MLSEWASTENWNAGMLFPHRSIPLHSMLTGCGHEMRDTPSYDLHGLKRGNAEFTIWQYTIAGEGSLDCDGASYKLRPGDAMMIHVPQNHRYRLAAGTPLWEFIYVSMNGRDAMRLWYELERLHGPVVKFQEDSKSVQAACEILRLAKAGELKTPFAASALAYKMLMAHFEDLSPYGAGEEGDRLLLKRIADFCLANISREISVDDLAEAAGYSKFHFSRLFRKSCGMPPASFLRDLRLKTAIRLLQMERMTVKEISAKCGFSDESYFCKLFKRSYGTTPEAFRHGGGKD